MFLLWVVFVTFAAGVQFPNCFNFENGGLERHFSTKTPYRTVANSHDRRITYEGCWPQRSWAVIRHGTRNPSAKMIRKMSTDLYKFRDEILNNSLICDNDKKLFKLWKCDLKEDQEKLLVLEGEDEMINLAERIQNRFPGLLSERYENSSYKFKFTATERTERSFKGFATGLFGRHNTKQIWYPEPLHRDPVLRFYKLCQKWRKDVNKNPKTYAEIAKFSKTELVENFMKSIRLKTGIPKLIFEDVQVMYETCAFETAWSIKNKSPWCIFFDKESIRILEFAEDLEYYWKDGYGFELTHRQTCPAIIDMIDHLKKDSEYPLSTFYFTHSGTILKLLAAFGLYKDDYKLKHTDFGDSRLWTTSKIDAFGSNIMFITYSCTDGNDYVLGMHQEQIIRLPGCPQNEDLCPFDVFKNIFKSELENCKFDEMCKL